MIRSMGVAEADSYSAHAFRRGASMELKGSGSTLPHVLKKVGWNSASFRAYLSLVEDEEVNIRSIFANFDVYEVSDEVEEVPLPPSSSVGETSPGTISDDKPLVKSDKQTYLERLTRCFSLTEWGSFSLRI